MDGAISRGSGSCQHRRNPSQRAVLVPQQGGLPHSTMTAAALAAPGTAALGTVHCPDWHSLPAPHSCPVAQHPLLLHSLVPFLSHEQEHPGAIAARYPLNK
jgi:hypothetical protein